MQAKTIIAGSAYGGLINAFDQMIGSSVYQSIPMPKIKSVKYIGKIVCGECGSDSQLRKFGTEYKCKKCFGKGRYTNE